MVLVVGAFKRSLDRESGALMNAISALIKESPLRSLAITPCEDTVRKRFQAVNQEVGLHRTGDYTGNFVLDFSTSRTVSSKIPVVYKLHSLWYFYSSLMEFVFQKVSFKQNS